MLTNKIQHNPAYPEFGEHTAASELKLKKVIKLVSQVALIIITATFIGYLAGSSAMGLVAGVVIVTTAVALHALIEKIRENRFFNALPKDTASPSGVGKYMQAHLRLAATSSEGLEWKKELIKSAELSLELSANFAGGSDFRDVLCLIHSKMEQKPRFKTHLLISSDLLEEQDKTILQDMQKHFGARFQLLVTDRHYRLTPQIHSEENHVKLMIVDGRYIVAGGTGIHPQLSRDQYDPHSDKETPTMMADLLEKASIDMDIVAESRGLAHTLRRQFFNLYRLWETRTTNTKQKSRHFSPTGLSGTCKKFHIRTGLFKRARLKCLVSGPEHRGNNAIVHAYAKRIHKAKSEVRLANLMFTPPKAIRTALTTTKAAFPHKKLIGYSGGLGHKNTFARSRQVYLSRTRYSLLDKAHEYKTDTQIYHKKVATFDDTHMIIGSFNLGKKSAKHDHEIAFVIKDSAIARRTKELLKQDGTSSTKITSHKENPLSMYKNPIMLAIAKLTENFI